MKTLYKSLLLFLFLFTAFQGKATHVMGSDIAWECLGNDKYKVTVRVYRDCNGVNLSNTRISFLGNCSGITTSTQTMSSGRDITPVCPGQCTRCSSRGCSFKYGVEEYKLTTTIDVSKFRKSGCCELTIAWSQCCRNGAITTGGANQNFYIQAKMNVCQTPCNNSPVFNSSPVNIMCLGRDMIIAAGAHDKDTVNGSGDSLVHSFTDPLTSVSGKTSWSSPYSSSQPIYFLGFPRSTLSFPKGLHLDAETGELMFRPMKVEQSIFAIKVEEYRSGKKISEITRDVQIVVIKCPNNNPPVLSGINCSKPTSNNFKIYACAGKPICFDVCTSDKDKNDSVEIEWNKGIPGATFTVINKGTSKRETGRFCWTPKKAHVSKFPYRFVVRANDNACPAEGFTARSYSIYVREAKKFSINTSSSASSSGCGVYDLNASTTDSSSNSGWEWYLNDSILMGKTGAGLSSKIHYKFPSNGTYRVKVLTNRSGCWESFYDSVVVTGLNPIKLPNIADQVVCADKRINIPFTATGGNGALTYSWSGTNLSNSGSQNTDEVDATFYNYAYNSTITYGATDSLGCSDSNTFSVRVKQLYTQTLGLDKVLCGDDTLNNDTLPLPTDSLFAGGKWSGPGVSGNVFSPKGLGTGSYTLTYLKDDANFCAAGNIDVLIANNPVANAGLDRLACPSSSPIKLGGSPVGGTWTGPKNTISRANEFLPKKASIGNNVLEYRVVDSNGCEDTDTLVIEVKNIRPNVDVGQDTSTCSGDSLLALAGIPAGGSWKGNFLIQQNGTTYFKSPTVQNTKNYDLVYTARDSNGCEGSDTLKITVKELPAVNAGADISHCFVGPKDRITLNGTPSGGLWKGYQLFGTNNVVELTANDIGSYEYTYEVSNAAGCSNTDKMTLTVREKPNVNAGLDDTLCLSSTISRPLVGKPAGGKWLGGNLSQNGGKYFAELSTTTLYGNTYEYEFTDNFGCTNSDEMTIYVGEETTTDFTPSVTSGSAPLKVDFTNNSKNGVSWYWNFGNGKNSQQFEPSTTYLGGGTFKVILLTVDGTGYCHSTSTETIKVSGGVGIATIPEGLVSLYPSPASESFVIENETGSDLDFTLYNETGQVVAERKIGKAAKFDVQSLPKGYYFYKMISANGQFHQDKLIVE